MENIHDFLKMVEEEKSINRKAEILAEQRGEDSQALQILFRSAFDPRIKWEIPETKPPFDENPENDWSRCELRLEEFLRRFSGRYCTFDGTLTAMAMAQNFRNRTACEMDFIGKIKQLHTSEADLLMELVNKRLPYKGITPRLVNQAFPGLIPE